MCINDKLIIRKVMQYTINNGMEPIRYDATWELPTGEARQFSVHFDTGQWEDPELDHLARQALESRMREDGGKANSSQIVLKLPPSAPHAKLMY